MANLTLTIPDDVLRGARIRALENDTSVNAVVRDFLEDFAGDDRQHEALEALDALAQRSHARSGPHGRTWTREEIYHERIGRYG